MRFGRGHLEESTDQCERVAQESCKYHISLCSTAAESVESSHVSDDRGSTLLSDKCKISLEYHSLYVTLAVIATMSCEKRQLL